MTLIDCQDCDGEGEIRGRECDECMGSGKVCDDCGEPESACCCDE